MADVNIPSVNISDAERAAMAATIESMENEDTATRTAGDGSAAGGAAGDQEAQAGAKAAGDVDADDAGGETDDGDGAGGSVGDGRRAPMIPKARFDEALARERERNEQIAAENQRLKERIEAVESRVNGVVSAPAAPETDFQAEKDKLQKQYDDGEIDFAKFQADRDKIVVAETAYTVHKQIAESTAAATQAQIQNEWNDMITAWTQEHAEFMANPIREKAVSDLLTQYGADQTLDNKALLEKVQNAAFEAFAYTPKKAEPGKPAANPRDVSDAAAAAAGSAIPGAIQGGEGNRATAAKPGLEGLKPGEFSKLSKADQAALLGGEAAL